MIWQHVVGTGCLARCILKTTRPPKVGGYKLAGGAGPIQIDHVRVHVQVVELETVRKNIGYETWAENLQGEGLSKM